MSSLVATATPYVLSSSPLRHKSTFRLSSLNRTDSGYSDSRDDLPSSQRYLNNYGHALADDSVSIISVSSEGSIPLLERLARDDQSSLRGYNSDDSSSLRTYRSDVSSVSDLICTTDDKRENKHLVDESGLDATPAATTATLEISAEEYPLSDAVEQTPRSSIASTYSGTDNSAHIAEELRMARPLESDIILFNSADSSPSPEDEYNAALRNELSNASSEGSGVNPPCFPIPEAPELESLFGDGRKLGAVSGNYSPLFQSNPSSPQPSLGKLRSTSIKRPYSCSSTSDFDQAEEGKLAVPQDQRAENPYAQADSPSPSGSHLQYVASEFVESSGVHGMSLRGSSGGASEHGRKSQSKSNWSSRLSRLSRTFRRNVLRPRSDRLESEKKEKTQAFDWRRYPKRDKSSTINELRSDSTTRGEGWTGEPVNIAHCYSDSNLRSTSNGNSRESFLSRKGFERFNRLRSRLMNSSKISKKRGEIVPETDSSEQDMIPPFRSLISVSRPDRSGIGVRRSVRITDELSKGYTTPALHLPEIPTDSIAESINSAFEARTLDEERKEVEACSSKIGGDRWLEMQIDQRTRDEGMKRYRSARRRDSDWMRDFLSTGYDPLARDDEDDSYM